MFSYSDDRLTSFLASIAGTGVWRQKNDQCVTLLLTEVADGDVASMTLEVSPVDVWNPLSVADHVAGDSAAIQWRLPAD